MWFFTNVSNAHMFICVHNDKQMSEQLIMTCVCCFFVLQTAGWTSQSIEDLGVIVSVQQRSWSQLLQPAPPPSISVGDPSPDSLLQGPSWAAAAASCLLTPLPPLLPVLGQTRLKPPLLSPTPPLISAGFSYSHTHSHLHTQVVSLVDDTFTHCFWQLTQQQGACRSS